MGPPDPSTATDLKALEEFVVNNDDLLALEERIGRFNIFDALGIARTEIRHSNFLAWLLDPAESHGQGSLFLKAVLMDLLKHAPAGQRPLSPVELDGEELRGVEVRREWRSIDLLITCDQPRFVVAIENKIDSGEHSDQLQRYEDAVAREFADVPADKRMFVFLTPEGEAASDEDWTPYGYPRLHGILTRVGRLNAGSIGDDVRVYLEHYLRLIGSRLMPNTEIEALCRRIYQNHRQALDLIYEHAGSPAAGLLGRLEGMLREQPEKWHVFNTTSKWIGFIPQSWLALLPPIGRRPNFDPRLWVVLSLEVGRTRVRWRARVWPTTDAECRLRVIDRLTLDKDEFGLRLFSRKIMSEEWTAIGNEGFADTPEEEGEEQAVVDAARKKVEVLWQRLAGVSDALRPISDEWKSKQPQRS